MKIAKKNLDPITTKKRELIEELYHFVRNNMDEEDAFFDLRINEKNPHKSRIRANRPGIELFATEVLLTSDAYFDDYEEIRNDTELLEAKKWAKKGASMGLSEIDMIHVERYENDLWHNSDVEKNKSFTGIVTFVLAFAVFLLALFGLVDVIRFFAS